MGVRLARRPDAGVGRAGRRAGHRGGQGQPAAVDPAHRARRRTGVRGPDLGVAVRRRPVLGPRLGQDRRCSPTGAPGLLAHDIVAHADASVHSVVENKFYADLAGTTTTQQRVRHPAPSSRPLGIDKESGRFDTMRTLAPPVGRGWEYLTGTGWDWAAELDELPEHLAEKLRAPVGRGRRLRPGHRPVQPVPHHPRVDRARDRAGPGARLRGQLRRHVVRDLRPARLAEVRLPGHERHR